MTNEFQAPIKIIQRSQHTWLDVECIGRRTKTGAGSIIVLDVPLANYAYLARKNLLSADFHKLGLYETPDPQQVYYLDFVDGRPNANLLWEKLRKKNAELGEEFYEGLVAKKMDSVYPIQSVHPEREHSDWVKYRWKF